MACVSPPSRLQAGLVLAGKYRLARRIGAGGMGDVWSAINESMGTAVALKVLTGDHEHASKRFRYEAYVGSLLAHRNIARTFDLVEESDGTLILIMELLRGATLRRHMEDAGAVPPPLAVAIMTAVLSGLKHAHAHGIVHRDVKPANIFLALDPDGHVTPKLLDFGIAKAKVASYETMDGDILGTPAYMSPEQIRAETLDGRSDMFAAAAILYELITGAPPFDPSVPSRTLAAVLEMPVDPDPRIPPALWLEIKRALGKRAQERHADVEEFAAALVAAIGATPESIATVLRALELRTTTPPGEPVASEQVDRYSAVGAPPFDIAPASSWPRRRREWLGAGIAAILAIALGIVARRAPSTPDATASAASPRSPMEVIDPPAPPPAPPPASAAASGSASAPPHPPRRPGPPAGGPRKRPVAITPGF